MHNSGVSSANNNLIHSFDPNGIRRTTNSLPITTNNQNNEDVSMTTTAVSLSRAFSIVIRQLGNKYFVVFFD